MRRIILPSVACVVVQSFSALYHKRHDVGGKEKDIEHKRMFRFSKSNENTNLMQHCAGFISAGSLYMFRAQAPIIRSI